MELWIRSQDKQIMLPNPILIVDDSKILTPKNDYRDTHLLLGHYKTKERALEVLDEIQNILKPTIITTGYECELKENIKDKTSFNLDMIPTKTEIQELSNVVYQMPEK